MRLFRLVTLRLARWTGFVLVWALWLSGPTPATVQAEPGAGPWSSFSPAEGLASDSILSLALDPSGVLWVGTNAGLSLLSPQGEWLSLNDSDGLAGNIVTDIAIDPQNPQQIWLATDNGATLLTVGANVLDQSQYRWTSFFRTDGLAARDLSTVTIGPDGRVWFGTNFVDVDGVETGAGLSVLDYNGTPAVKSDDLWTTYSTVTSKLSHNVVRDIAIDPEGTVWVATQSGLNVLKDDLWTVFYTTHGLPSNDLTRLLWARDLLWIGSENGLAVLDWGGTHNRSDDRIERFQYSNSGIIDDNISALAIDSAGYLWVGTNTLTIDGEDGDGVSAFNFNGTPFDRGDDRWYVYGAPHGLASGSIRTLIPGEGATVWFGTRYGLSLLDYGESPFSHDDDTWENYYRHWGLVGNSVSALLPFDGTSMWVGSSAGLSLFRHGGTVHTKTDDAWDYIFSANVTALASDSQGRLWIGTTSGLTIWDHNGSPDDYWDDLIVDYYGTSPLLDDQINDIVIDDQDRAWIASGNFFNGGLQIFDPGPLLRWRSDDLWMTFTSQNSALPGPAAQAVAWQGEDAVWVGTHGGVALLNYADTPFDYQDDVWQIFNTQNTALRYNGVQDIFVEENGTVWLAHTIEGVSASTPAGTWQTFTHADGLTYDAVYAITQDRQGRIWFGTDGGGVGVLDYGGTLADKSDDRWLTYRGGETLLSGHIRALATDMWGQMWVGSFGGGVDVHSTVDLHKLHLPFVIDHNSLSPIEPPWEEVPPIEEIPIEEEEPLP